MAQNVRPRITSPRPRLAPHRPPRRLPRALALRTLACCAALAFLTADLRAAEILVTQVQDVLGAGDGCSLREAVLSANTDTAIGDCGAGSGADVLLLDADSTYLLSRAGTDEDSAQTGDLDILWHTTIRPSQPAGQARIDAQGLDRILHVLAGADLTLERIELMGGAGVVFGGGVASFDPVSVLDFDDVEINGCAASLRGGGVLSAGPLTLTEVEMSNNAAAFGGALSIEAGGSLTATELTATSNDAEGGDGGAIYAAGPVTCDDCRINSNEARDGGGVHMENDARLVLRKTDMIGNHATGFGGAIHAAEIRLDAALLWENEAFADGGAIYLRDEGPGLVSTLVNTTLTTNVAAGNGGAVVHAGSGSLGLYSSTIAYNVSNGDESGAEPTGGLVASTGTTTLRNTVVAPNYALPDAGSRNRGVDPGGDCEGTLASEGHNLLGAVGGVCTLADSPGGDQTGTPLSPLDPRLECLQEFGDVDEFDALPPEPTSPLLDAGEPTGCRAPNGTLLAEDIGGRHRVWDGPDGDEVAVCDIGALELGSVDTALLFADGFESGDLGPWGGGGRRGWRPSDVPMRGPRRGPLRGGGGGGPAVPCFEEE